MKRLSTPLAIHSLHRNLSFIPLPLSFYLLSRPADVLLLIKHARFQPLQSLNNGHVHESRARLVPLQFALEHELYYMSAQGESYEAQPKNVDIEL